MEFAIEKLSGKALGRISRSADMALDKELGRRIEVAVELAVADKVGGRHFCAPGSALELCAEQDTAGTGLVTAIRPK